MLLWLLRGFFAALLFGIAAFALGFFLSEPIKDTFSGIVAAAFILLIGGIVVFTDVREKNKQIAVIAALFLGLLLGLLLGWLVSLVLEPIVAMAFSGPPEQVKTVNLIWRFVATAVCCYITITTLLQTRDDFRFIIPYVEFSKQVKGNRPLVLDTSVIIDGRIADLCDTHLVDSRLIVPRFVLQELQGIADSSDKLKRNRGRRGLDVLKRLQSNAKIDLQMHEGADASARPGERIRVDERLVLFTKAVGGRVVTNDFNLNKVAQLQGVDVINLNEVANSLKTVALPGESLTVKVVKPGDQYGQGVGYLDDGTMVVVEQGRGLIGQDVPLVVTSVLQTPAGRMIFGRPESSRPSGAFAPVGSGTHQPVGERSGPHQAVTPAGDQQRGGPQHPPAGPPKS